MGASSFDQVSNHLHTFGGDRPMRLDQIDDMELMEERLKRVHKLSSAHAKVELSPYMELLLGVTRTAAKQQSVVKHMVAVGS